MKKGSINSGEDYSALSILNSDKYNSREREISPDFN
jgi:hypothetical protein